MPIFIPDFKVKETPIPKPIFNPSPQRTEPQPQLIRETSQAYKNTANPRPIRNERLDILQPESIIKPKYVPNDLMKSSSRRSNVSQTPDSIEDESYLRASRFAGNDKTLFECLNPKGKSD
jgi:hypothetical protein